MPQPAAARLSSWLGMVARRLSISARQKCACMGCMHKHSKSISLLSNRRQCVSALRWSTPTMTGRTWPLFAAPLAAVVSIRGDLQGIQALIGFNRSTFHFAQSLKWEPHRASREQRDRRRLGPPPQMPLLLGKKRPLRNHTHRRRCRG